MDYKFDNDKPIYKQLVDQLKLEIITGKYKPNDKLPSVREFAIELKVNPNTVQRALLELEDSKLIETRRTTGKFVTDNKKIIDNTKTEIINNIMKDFFNNIENLNISNEEIIKYIKQNRKEK